MGLELFNKTSRVKELPKYNYNGKIKLGPNGTFPIQDYMRPFYKPFEKIGVIVRRSAVIEEVEPEVQKILSESVPETFIPEDNKKIEVPIKEENVESLVEESQTPEVNEDKGSTEETIEEKDPERKIYTEEELKEIKIDDMKVILDGLGVNYKEFPNKRAAFVEAILNAQK